MSSLAQAEFHPVDVWRPTINPWGIAGTVMLATFMEVLDTSIANVSLPHIAGSLSASVDESTWVLTSYLISNAIVLPLTGWLSCLDASGSSWLRGHLHRQLVSLRLCPQPRCAAHFLPRVCRAPEAEVCSPSRKPSWWKASRAKSKGWRWRSTAWACGGAYHRPDARRLDHRQLFVALDLLHQCSRRRGGHSDDHALI